MNRPVPEKFARKSSDDPYSLPLRGRPERAGRRVILGSHLVLNGYGFWLSNDLRGSGSTETRKEELKQLGDIHYGRKRKQPSREDIRSFYKKAEPLLDHDTIWFRDKARKVIGDSIGVTAKLRGYTIWACAVCSNHAHMVVRTHRDSSDDIWANFMTGARQALWETDVFPLNHPVWSHRPWKVFLYTPLDVTTRIDYVVKNPEKEGLPRQHYDFVQSYR